jgi:hypothetical protein
LYDTSNCLLWLQEFAAMSGIVPADLIRRLLALQFPARPDQPGLRVAAAG